MSENNIVYRNAAELPMMEEVTENTYAIVSDGGVLKRVPGSMLGGGGGVKTAIIKSSDYDNAIAGLQTTLAEGDTVTYECVNMTFEEAYQTMASGEPLAVMVMIVADIPTCVYGAAYFAGTADTGEPTIGIVEQMAPFMQFTWTANGIEGTQPK